MINTIAVHLPNHKYADDYLASPRSSSEAVALEGRMLLSLIPLSAAQINHVLANFRNFHLA